MIARTTAMFYRGSKKRVDQIGQELGAGYVLEGSLRREDSRLRVTAQLIETSGQTLLWSETYDRQLSGVLSLERELAQRIAREIRLVLPARDALGQARSRTIAPRAYEAYLRGRHELNEMTPASLVASVRLFRLAMKRDPRFALAHASLANALALLAIAPMDALAPRKAMPAAKAAARKAVSLDASLAEAHTALGLTLHHYDWDWAEAERAYAAAMRLNPAYLPAILYRAWLLMSLSRHMESLEQLERAEAIAREIDPRLVGTVLATRGAAYYFLRQFNMAIVECRKAMEADASSVVAYYVMGRALARIGGLAQAIEHFEGMRQAGTVSKDNLLLFIAHAHAAAVSGKPTESRRALEELRKLACRQYVPSTYFAILYAVLGQQDRAFAWFEKAYRERADGMTLLNVEPMVDGLRSDPRFQTLLCRIGLARRPLATSSLVVSVPSGAGTGNVTVTVKNTREAPGRIEVHRWFREARSAKPSGTREQRDQQQISRQPFRDANGAPCRYARRNDSERKTGGKTPAAREQQQTSGGPIRSTKSVSRESIRNVENAFPIANPRH